MMPRMSQLRVSLVLENAYDAAIAARRGRAAVAAVRSVETIGVIDIDMGDRSATPLWVPEDVIRRLGIKEWERRWDARPWAGPITLRLGDRHATGECVVVPPGSPVRVGSIPLRIMDLEPDLASKMLRPGKGIRI